MPLFKQHRNTPEPVTTQPQTYDDTPNRKSSLFSRRHRSTSPVRTQMNTRSTNGNTGGGGGFFSRNRSRSSSGDSMGRGSGRHDSGAGFNSSIHGRHSNDPSTISARQKVGEAEEAERQADRALVEARAAVRDAKQHVKNLEREIEEEARMYRMKQQEAKQVSKSAKGLGRHG